MQCESLLRSRRGVAGGNGRRGAAADGEIADDGHSAGFQDGDQIVQDRVHDGFVENSLVAIGEEIELEAFHLHAEAVGDIDVIVMVAKSGWPVTGQTLVNSGKTNLIS